MTGLLKRLRAYLNQRQVNKLRVKRARLQGEQDARREFGRLNAHIQGQIAATDERISQLVAADVIWRAKEHA